MQPTYISIGEIFGHQVRHTVPLFQRPYVWGREEQWEALWEDVSGLLERIRSRKGEAAIAGHFLGTVVLEQTPNATGSLPRREVIDGQQRLTTLQIMLKAAEHALSYRESQLEDDESKKTLSIARRQVAFLTENPAYSKDEERYKVWPTNEDRAPFRKVMDCTMAEPVGPTFRMGEAYWFFRQKCSEHLNGELAGERALSLASALKDHLRLIVLDLDASDEPQAIFETLNAHGTPLLPADLIKNWLLWEATRQKLDLSNLYDKYWRIFDHDHEYWRKRVGVGHAARARVDTFLQNWLTTEIVEVVSTKHLYDRFLRHMKALSEASDGKVVDVEKIMGSIRHSADLYCRIDNPTGKTRFDEFLRRLKVLDVVVLHPPILALLSRAGSNQSDLDEVAVAVESYLVRRTVCGYQTRGYGTLALSLLKEISSAPAELPVAQVVKGFLKSSVSASEVWPNDALFRGEWIRRRFYGGLRRERVAMILQAIEEAYQSEADMSEPIIAFDFAKLQIEHILPQKWHEHWPLDSQDLAEERDALIHSIGNLTLISDKLNPSLSNAPWASSSATSKRKGLEKHSKLELNRRLLEDGGPWNHETISARSQALFEKAKDIWPDASQI
jgi:hypothetical protein